MKLKKWEVALIILTAIFILTGIYAENASTALSGKLIRLHVVANSDGEDDQSLKLAVRDRVLAELAPKLEGVADRAEAERVIRCELPALEKAARCTVREWGSDDPVSVTLARESFPTRDYETFSLPAGEYTSLRVTIGSGAGHNWWCVVYPAICTSSDPAAAAIGLTEEELSTITKDGAGYVVRFRLLELWGRIFK